MIHRYHQSDGGEEDGAGIARLYAIPPTIRQPCLRSNSDVRILSFAHLSIIAIGGFYSDSLVSNQRTEWNDMLEVRRDRDEINVVRGPHLLWNHLILVIIVTKGDKPRVHRGYPRDSHVTSPSSRDQSNSRNCSHTASKVTGGANCGLGSLDPYHSTRITPGASRSARSTRTVCLLPSRCRVAPRSCRYPLA